MVAEKHNPPAPADVTPRIPPYPPDDDSAIVSRTLLADVLIALTQTVRRLEQKLPTAVPRSPVDQAVLGNAHRALIQGAAALQMALPAIDRIDGEISLQGQLVAVLRTVKATLDDILWSESAYVGSGAAAPYVERLREISEKVDNVVQQIPEAL